MKEGLHIVGMGHYAPEHVVTNDDLSKIVDTNDEWISSRTGIRRRHFITEEKNQDMAIAAAKMAIEDAGIDKSEIGVVIVATIRPDHMTPSVACMVQKKLELPQDIPCFDINAACSGFMYGVQIARGMLLQNDKKYGVVVGSETLSKILDMNDRSTCILFGDGAGAVLLKASDRRPYLPVAHSDGRQKAALTMRSRHDGGRDFLAAEYDLQMDGQAVFKFAVRKVPEVIREVLEKNHLRMEDIRYFLLHQANRRIIEAVARHLGIAVEKFPMNVAHCGNTSSASIPILLDELNHEGKLQKGDRLVLAGFGAGLTWGATVVEW